MVNSTLKQAPAATETATNPYARGEETVIAIPELRYLLDLASIRKTKL